MFISFVFLFLFLLNCGSEKNKENKPQTQINRPELPQGILHYTPPEDWIAEHPSSRMRRGQYRLPGVDGKGDAILAIFNFPGTGGSVKANLDRWYRQMKQPNGSDTKAHVQRKDIVVNGIPVTMIYVTGTYLQSASGMMRKGEVKEKPGYAMLAAIAETADSPWFFKATGPKETIDKHRDNFEEFVQSFRVFNKES